ncbi:MAG: alpha/beta hydrolase [Planctomycetota bacterium]
MIARCATSRFQRTGILTRSPRVGFAALIVVCLALSGCLAPNRCDAWKPVNIAQPQHAPATPSSLDAGKDANSAVAKKLRDEFIAEPTRPHAFALAEFHYAHGDLADRAGSEASIDHFYLSASYAYYHLFAIPDGQTPNPRMWDLYHSSLARCIQNGQSKGRLDPHKELVVLGADQPLNVPLDHQAGPWKADDFDQLLVVGDYDTTEIVRRYKRDGLGVPLVGIRLRRNDGTPRDAFLAPRQSFSVTAVLRPDLDWLVGKKSARAKTNEIELAGGANRTSLQTMTETSARIELIDPSRSATVDVGSRSLPLAGDFSAAFAACEDCRSFMRLDWLGFREPSRLDKLSGLFFLEPYQPGKIPVVFIHGLWSDFHTWDETLNEIRMNPIIRERYQFAVYLYPTGNPFTLNAMRLRKTLAEMRALVSEPDPAMNEMVLVGHSMGGILARLQISASNNTLWENVSKRPIESLKAEPDTFDVLKSTFFFDPNPSVKRVVFIGTPQKGSNLGGSCLRRVASSLVRQPGEIQAAVKKLSEDNPGAFKPAFLGGLPTSIDNLATDNPTLKAINRMPLNPQTQLHSIVGHGKLLPLFQPGDGVVPTASARLGGVRSELLIDDWHTHVHRDLRSIREIERILHEHLEDADRPKQ